MTPEIVFWSCRDYDERLTHENQDEAIEEYLDGMSRQHWPETLTVYGWQRQSLPAARSYRGDALERLLEILDEEYGNPDEASEPTKTMEEAERVFIETVLREYTVWTCKVVAEHSVNVREWVAKNCPEWLKEGAA